MNDKLQDEMKFSNVLRAWKVSLPKFTFPLNKICPDLLTTQSTSNWFALSDIVQYY